MKKRLVILVVITLICLLFVSCRHKEIYTFLNSIDKISSVSIVIISFDGNGELVETEAQKIKDITDFLTDFKNIDCYTYYGDPVGITEEGVEDTVIKIAYDNNEYELINWKGQTEYTQENGLRYYAGFSVFDEEQFELLITKYLSG